MRSIPYWQMGKNESEAAELRRLIDDPNTSWRDRTNAQARLGELERQAAAARIDRQVQRRETARSTLCVGSKVVTGTEYGVKPGCTATMLVPAPSLQQEVATLQARVERETAKLERAGLVTTNVPPQKAAEPEYMPISPYWEEK
jgi:hypothetical protein